MGKCIYDSKYRLILFWNYSFYIFFVLSKLLVNVLGVNGEEVDIIIFMYIECNCFYVYLNLLIN